MEEKAKGRKQVGRKDGGEEGGRNELHLEPKTDLAVALPFFCSMREDVREEATGPSTCSKVEGMLYM
eukprot:763591-Hanusia_phi.AAC.3